MIPSLETGRGPLAIARVVGWAACLSCGACEDGARTAHRDAPAASPRAPAECWRLPRATRARLLAAPGAARELVGGALLGSNQSATNGYRELARVEREPAEGRWVELTWSTDEAYRFVKYDAPPASRGRLAELQLFEGETRLSGSPFGTEKPGDGGQAIARAFDDDPASFFVGALPDQSYVGLDLARGHVTAAPRLSPPPGELSLGGRVELHAPVGSEIAFTLDGSDPRSPPRHAYRGPIELPVGSTLLRAVATGPCALASDVVQGTYVVGSDAAVTPGLPLATASMHVGNSLTDVLVDVFVDVSSRGGVTLDFSRYTIPGAGLWLYAQAPTGGFGVDDVQATLKRTPFDHLVLQPFPNMPCQPAPSEDGDDSDAGYADRAWTDALGVNPEVQLWIYQQWPAPRDYRNCLTGGAWTRGDWHPPAPASWQDAVRNELAYHEAVVARLVQMRPERRPPRVVPVGLALVELQRAIEGGEVPGVAGFFEAVFSAGGTDIHPTPLGAYFVAQVFYARLFERDPRAQSPSPDLASSPALARSLREIAWRSVRAYAASRQ